MPAPTLDTTSILALIGFVGTIIGCTWRLSSRITKGIQSTQANTEAVRDLSSTFHSHVLESNDRDKQNQREHAMLNRCCDSNLEALKNLGKRVDTLEPKMENDHVRLAVIETRLDIPRGSHS